MNRILPYPLWIGHGGEECDLAPIYEAGIEAVVELSVEEPPFPTPRQLITCRFPIIDGAGNPPERLALALRTVTALVAWGVPTLVCCACGMSRSPAVVAAALAQINGGSPVDWLERVTEHHPSDVSPGLWSDIVRLPSERIVPETFSAPT